MFASWTGNLIGIATCERTEPGEQALLKCHYGENIVEAGDVSAVWLIRDRGGNEVKVVECHRFQNNGFDCIPKDGYNHIGTISDQMVINIPRARPEHHGTYYCKLRKQQIEFHMGSCDLEYKGKNTSALSLSSSIQAVAKSVVKFGASWGGQTVASLQKDDFSITVVLEVENWSRFYLHSPLYQLHSGDVSKSPSLSFQPASSEVMVAHTTWLSAWGSSGTVSWVIDGLDRRVYVMWSVPNSYAYYKNKLVVGLSRSGYTSHPDNLFDLMYDGKSNNDLRCSSAQFSKNVSPVTYSDGKIKVTGIMTTSYEAHVQISVSPAQQQDLAPIILERLQQQGGK